MSEVEQLYQAWQTGGYILFIAILAGGLTRALRGTTWLWERLPDKHKRWVPVVIAALGAFADAVMGMVQSKPAAVVIVSAIITSIVAGLSAIGGHHFVNPEKHAAPAPAPVPVKNPLI